MSNVQCTSNNKLQFINFKIYFVNCCYHCFIIVVIMCIIIRHHVHYVRALDVALTYTTTWCHFERFCTRLKPRLYHWRSSSTAWSQVRLVNHCQWPLAIRWETVVGRLWGSASDPFKPVKQKLQVSRSYKLCETISVKTQQSIFTMKIPVKKFC